MVDVGEISTMTFLPLIFSLLLVVPLITVNPGRSQRVMVPVVHSQTLTTSDVRAGKGGECAVNESEGK